MIGTNRLGTQREEERVDIPFDQIRKGVGELVRQVAILPMETEDGSPEWCFAPGEGDEREISRLLSLFDSWESYARDSLLRLHPGRNQEIIEVLRIVRSKIALNRTNRHFMGYIREGALPSTGRDFYLTTFERTLDHLQGIWEQTLRREEPSGSPSLLPEGR